MVMGVPNVARAASSPLTPGTRRTGDGAQREAESLRTIDGATLRNGTSPTPVGRETPHLTRSVDPRPRPNCTAGSGRVVSIY